jgi:hypothetical protein
MAQKSEKKMQKSAKNLIKSWVQTPAWVGILRFISHFIDLFQIFFIEFRLFGF